MKKWQKITGSIALVVLAILNVAICISSFNLPVSIYFEPSGTTYDAIEIVRKYSQSAIKDVSYLVCANYIIALFLFIYIWRKGGKR